MSQEAFVRRHEAEWAELEGELRAEGAPAAPRADFPERYRRLCQHLALAQARRYSGDVVARLNSLALRGHRVLYPTRPDPWARLWSSFAYDFPARVREEWRFVLLAAVAFYGPAFGFQLAIHLHPQLVHTVMDAAAIAALEDMYDPASAHLLRERAADSDFMMFGFYIYNNISIALRTFASGALLGVGSLFLLVYNAVMIGTAAGHIDVVGFGGTFYPFVIGHSAFELNAIVLAGMSGLRLGWSVVAPGPRSRGASLRWMAARSLPVVLGFVGMLVIAAFLEAFWSSSVSIPGAVRLGVGAGMWALVALWLGLAGRDRAPR